MTKKYDPSSYRVVFFSSAPIGVPFLEQLAEDPRFNLVGVVTMPDAPAGRGLKVQENVIKTVAKTLVCRYFFLVKSLSPDWQQVFAEHNIARQRREDRGIIVYADRQKHREHVALFQQLLLPGPRYFDTRGAHNLIIYKDKIFDLRAGQDAAAKEYGRTLSVPEEQLDRSAGTNEKVFSEAEVNPFLRTPHSLREDSKKYADEAKETKQWLESLEPDFFVVIAYGNILPQYILDIPTFGSMNVHGSLLPAYRGASPLQAAFLDEKTESGMTIMKMDAGIDTGEMIRTLRTPLPISWTVKNFISWIKENGPTFLTTTLRDRAKGTITSIPQDHTQATGCRKFEKEDGLIDPLVDDIAVVYRKRQAFAVWPKLYFFWEKKRIPITELKLQPGVTRKDLTGTLFTQTGSTLTLHPAIQMITLTPEGKAALTREEFVNGYVNKQTKNE